MSKPIFITHSFNHDLEHMMGEAVINDNPQAALAWEMFIKGELEFAPSFVKRPGGRLELIELSLVPTGTAMPKEKRLEYINSIAATPEEV